MASYDYSSLTRSLDGLLQPAPFLDIHGTEDYNSRETRVGLRHVGRLTPLQDAGRSRTWQSSRRWYFRPMTIPGGRR